MAGILANNWINVRPGDPAFSVATNICDWFQLGNPSSKDYWLEGLIAGGGEFLLNGRLFLPNAGGEGTIIDNFPKAPAPKGWTKRQRTDGDGYELVSDGTVLFGYRVISFEAPGAPKASHLCMVTVNLYAADGVPSPGW